MKQHNGNTSRVRRLGFGVTASIMSMTLVLPVQIAFADVTNGTAQATTPAPASATTTSFLTAIPLPGNTSVDQPSTASSPQYEVRLANADPAPPPPPPAPAPDPKAPAPPPPPEPDPKAPSPSPSTSSPPVITWKKLRSETRNASGSAYWPDTPVQYPEFPGVEKRTATPIGLPECPDGTNSCHNYRSSNVCRFQYRGGWTDPFERDYARTVAWSGWYGVDIMEKYSDGKATGETAEWRNDKASYSMGACGYGGGIRDEGVMCAIRVGPINISGPNPVKPGEGRYGDYGIKGRDYPAFAGRRAIDQHDRPGEPVVDPGFEGAWANGAPEGRRVVDGYDDPTVWGPGLYNSRTVPREPWNVRQNGADWTWRGEFGDAYVTRGRNLYGLGNNIRSLQAYNSCLGQRVNLPNPEQLYGYGNYRVEIERRIAECRVWVQPTYDNLILFRGCSEPITKDARKWMISACQGDMTQRPISFGPEEDRIFDPSNCVTGNTARTGSAGLASCNWDYPSNPFGLDIPDITAPNSRDLARGNTENINLLADAKRWTVRYPAPRDMTVFPIDGPDYRATNSSGLPRQVGVPLNSSLQPDAGDGHSSTKWLLWNVSHTSSPWKLSENPNERNADGTRRHGVRNPNSDEQPFGTYIAGQYNKLVRIGAGVSTRRDEDDQRSVGAVAQGKDAGESRATWSQSRRTMDIWFRQPGSFPSTAFPFMIQEQCSSGYSRIGACSQGKNFATRVRYFQMFRVNLIEGAFVGLRSSGDDGEMDLLTFDSRDIAENRHRHIVVGECITNWNSFRVLGPRAVSASGSR